MNTKNARMLPGMTLYELMLVVALIGVMAAIAVPSVSAQAEKQKALEESVKMVSMLKQARAMALSNRSCVRVDITTNTMMMTEMKDDGDESDGDFCEVMATAGTPETMEMVTTSAPAPMYFFRDGTMGPAVNGIEAQGPQKMTLTGRDGRQRIITVYPAIGRVTLNDAR